MIRTISGLSPFRIAPHVSGINYLEIKWGIFCGVRRRGFAGVKSGVVGGVIFTGEK